MNDIELLLALYRELQFTRRAVVLWGELSRRLLWRGYLIGLVSNDS